LAASSDVGVGVCAKLILEIASMPAQISAVVKSNRVMSQFTDNYRVSRQFFEIVE
jgi:hypothetical protein